jgi:hypothetical protein
VAVSADTDTTGWGEEEIRINSFPRSSGRRASRISSTGAKSRTTRSRSTVRYSPSLLGRIAALHVHKMQVHDVGVGSNILQRGGGFEFKAGRTWMLGGLPSARRCFYLLAGTYCWP